MEQNQKHYYAFISHSTVDENVALWLRKELEGYHIPSAVQRDYHAPKRLRPIRFSIDFCQSSSLTLSTHS